MEKSTETFLIVGLLVTLLSFVGCVPYLLRFRAERQIKLRSPVFLFVQMILMFIVDLMALIEVFVREKSSNSRWIVVCSELYSAKHAALNCSIFMLSLCVFPLLPQFMLTSDLSESFHGKLSPFDFKKLADLLAGKNSSWALFYGRWSESNRLNWVAVLGLLINFLFPTITGFVGHTCSRKTLVVALLSDVCLIFIQLVFVFSILVYLSIHHFSDHYGIKNDMIIGSIAITCWAGFVIATKFLPIPNLLAFFGTLLLSLISFGFLVAFPLFKAWRMNEKISRLVKNREDKKKLRRQFMACARDARGMDDLMKYCLKNLCINDFLFWASTDEFDVMFDHWKTAHREQQSADKDQSSNSWKQLLAKARLVIYSFVADNAYYPISILPTTRSGVTSVYKYLKFEVLETKHKSRSDPRSGTALYRQEDLGKIFEQAKKQVAEHLSCKTWVMYKETKEYKDYEKMRTTLTEMNSTAIESFHLPQPYQHSQAAAAPESTQGLTSNTSTATSKQSTLSSRDSLSSPVSTEREGHGYDDLSERPRRGWTTVFERCFRKNNAHRRLDDSTAHPLDSVLSSTAPHYITSTARDAADPDPLAPQGRETEFKASLWLSPPGDDTHTSDQKLKTKSRRDVTQGSDEFLLERKTRASSCDASPGSTPVAGEVEIVPPFRSFEMSVSSEHKPSEKTTDDEEESDVVALPHSVVQVAEQKQQEMDALFRQVESIRRTGGAGEREVLERINQTIQESTEVRKDLQVINNRLAALLDHIDSQNPELPMDDRVAIAIALSQSEKSSTP